MGITAPNCEHDRNNIAPSTGWILTCRACFENAVRQNLLKYADQTLPHKLEDELKAARAQIQKMASDIEDMKASRRTAFIRCSCGRLKDLNTHCRSCGV